MATGSDWNALVPEVWSAKMQSNLEKSLVAFDIARTELANELKVGDKIHRSYVSNVGTADYVPGTDIVITGITATDDFISIDHKKVAAFYVDDIEELQAKPHYAAELADDAAYQLRDAIDMSVLSHVNDAASALGVSGSATGTFVTGTTATLTGITATTATIIDVFSAARKYLRKGNVEEGGDWIAVLSPDVVELIEKVSIEKGFNAADASLRNGYAGPFMGFRIYISNNLPANRCYFGRNKMIDLILLRAPKMDIKQEPRKLGRNFIASTVWGDGVLTRNKERFINAMLTA